MLDLSIGDLADISGGELLWSDLPPLGGRHEPVRGIAFDTRRIRPGDLLWCMSSSCWDHPAASTEAFRKGAAGVAGERFAAPWAGTYSLRVPDACESLFRLASYARRRFCGKLIAVAAGNQTAAVCRVLQTVLSRFATGNVCPILRRRGIWLPTGLLEVRPDWDFVVLPVFDLQKDTILRLSCPHLAVITPHASCESEPVAPRVRPWLPDSGQLIEVETIREAAARAAVALEIPESEIAAAIDAALEPEPRSTERAA